MTIAGSRRSDGETVLDLFRYRARRRRALDRVAPEVAEDAGPRAFGAGEEQGGGARDGSIRFALFLFGDAEQRPRIDDGTRRSERAYRKQPRPYALARATLALQREEVPAILLGIDSQPLLERDVRRGAMLEPPLGKHRHLDPEQVRHAGREDLALEAVELRRVGAAERGVRDSLRDCNHPRARERARTREPVPPRRRAGAHVPAREPAAVGLRVLERLDPPTLVVEHPVGDHAPDRELAVLLDRVVLEVLVAAVAVEQIHPVRVALAERAQEREVHGSALDVERLVVLDHLDGEQGVDGCGVRFDRLTEVVEPGALEERARLCQVLAAAVDRQRERLEASRALARVEQRSISAEQDRAAVGAAGEGDADRRAGRQSGDPGEDLVVEGANVAPPDLAPVGG